MNSVTHHYRFGLRRCPVACLRVWLAVSALGLALFVLCPLDSSAANPYARTNSEVPFLTHTSKGAQLINRKLEEIVLPEVHFDGVPLAEVVKRLSEAAKKFDPDPDPKKKGLNFLINDVSPQLPLIDANGNPVPRAQSVALSEGLIRVGQPLKNLTLRHALDVICKNAEQPTQFSVEEYAIAFIPRGPVAYYSRVFRVNPNAFIQGLQGVVGNPVLGVERGRGRASRCGRNHRPRARDRPRHRPGDSTHTCGGQRAREAVLPTRRRHRSWRDERQHAGDLRPGKRTAHRARHAERPARYRAGDSEGAALSRARAREEVAR